MWHYFKIIYKRFFLICLSKKNDKTLGVFGICTKQFFIECCSSSHCERQDGEEPAKRLFLKLDFWLMTKTTVSRTSVLRDSLSLPVDDRNVSEYYFAKSFARINILYESTGLLSLK